MTQQEMHDNWNHGMAEMAETLNTLWMDPITGPIIVWALIIVFGAACAIHILSGMTPPRD